VGDDPRWPRASAWLAGKHESDPVARLSVLGVPLHIASISPSRADLAPEAIRTALERFSVWDGEADLRRVAAEDLGDLDLADASPEQALHPVVQRMGTASELTAWTLLGGDNSIARPGVHGLGVPLERVGLLTLDAHFDLRDTDAGLRNGNPVRALLEDGLPGTNVVQVGIQPFANSPAYAEIAREAGITSIPADEVRARGASTVVSEALEQLADRADAIYVDLDVDVLDRAFAPACPGARPGGLRPDEVQAAARTCGRHPLVRAIDVVEVDPAQDIAGTTVLTAASFLLAFAAGLAARS
jgi:formimidoylglutamase